MAGWFFDRFMDKLFDIGFDSLLDRYFGGRTGMKEGLERLRVNRTLLQAAASACTQGKITDPDLKSWYWLLRDAIDEAGDVLDDFEYMKHQELLELNVEETKVRSSFDGSVLEPARKIRKVCERPFKIDPKRLEEAVQKLDRVSAQVNNFLHLVEKEEKEQQGMDQQLSVDRASGSSPGPVFIGRDQEKEFVMMWLSEPSNHNLSLLSIVGHGGMGKTTLLQNIYADERTREFDLKIWVRVSQGFKVEEVITDMLKYIRKWRSHLTENSLHDRLKSVMRSKKFLLVLDDIWEERTTTKWEKVISLLADGKLGSKILVTTRTDAAASMIPGNIIEKKTSELNGLEDAECLELLRTHAFSGKNILQYQKLMGIVDKIGKRLSGSPLAAKVIGGILNSNFNESVWMNILNSTNILNVEPGRNSILPILKLSFPFLSQPQQNCFAFCGIFPQDHKFDKDDLVRMWIALGFIQESSNVGETLEDIGASYFDDLLRNSFFDQFQDFGRIYYKMHDLLHDLAQSISSEECFRFVGGNVSLFRCPETIRHLSVNADDLTVLRMIKDVKNLHSLFLTSRRDGEDFTEILGKIFEASRSIRLLFIDSTDLKMMPEAIKNLRHLRYLNLRVHLTQMPRSLSSLYHLRFIIHETVFQEPYSHDFLPGDVSNLSNLRHFGLAPEVISSVPEIGKLRSLQELDEFNVKNENGYRIGELKHMSELRKLKINFLENVNDATEARNAKLFEKIKLTDLFLNWGNTVDDVRKSHGRVGSLRNINNSELDLNVLNNLKPYKDLKRLSIFSYNSVRSAEWMSTADSIFNLEYISLNGCSEWETLPPFGQLRSLKSLYLCNMPKAKRLDYRFLGNEEVSVFPSLEVLHMEGLQVLEDWFDGAGAAADDCFFPSLRELFLENCPNLKELPYLPHKLKDMRIRSIGWKAWNFNQGGTSKSIPLETLEVRWCPNITSLLLAGVRLEALRKLRIEGCPNLFSLGGLQAREVVLDDPSLLPTLNIASLEKLTICNNSQLWSLPSLLERLSSVKILSVKRLPSLWQLLHIPPSLKELRLQFLDLLCHLPSSSAISSLELLDLTCIPHLYFLPDLPSSLDYLSLRELERLVCLPSLSDISNLKDLYLHKIPSLESLPDLPSSLDYLSLRELENLRCLPSSLSDIPSLKDLRLASIPSLNSLPDLPSSLDSLSLHCLDNLQCLPSSLLTISSLNRLDLDYIPLLKSLPELPPSLNSLSLRYLKLECLPSLSAISSLELLELESIPHLKSLPDLPSSCSLHITDCDPELMKRYK